MKKTLKLIPALAMLLVSAILVSTSTYAWFSMNSQVTATNMKVKAVAEQGIVISNSAKGTWTNTSEAQVAAATVVPTSTPAIAAPTWVHAMSPDADNANAQLTLGGSYSDLTLTWSAAETYTGAATTKVEGIGYTEHSADAEKQNSYQAAEDTAYVLMNTFYIRSAADSMDPITLYINDVTVEAKTDANASGSFHAIDNALRVLVVLTEYDTSSHVYDTAHAKAFLYAPVYNQASATTTTSYKWKGTTDVKARYASAETDSTAAGYDADLVGVDVATGITSIPNTAEEAVKVQIYMWYEGEDANLKSTNIANITLDNLSLTVKFGTTTIH